MEDLTYPQYLVLMVLWEQDKQPVCDIAKRLLLETNTVTPLLQRMERADLITRAKGEVDTRQRIVSLTDKGRAMQKKAVDIHESIRDDMALDYGEEEAEEEWDEADLKRETLLDIICPNHTLCHQHTFLMEKSAEVFRYGFGYILIDINQ